MERLFAAINSKKMTFLSVVFGVGCVCSIAGYLDIIYSKKPSRKDLTLVSGASGVEVVDACIQKLNTIPAYVFANDYGFTKRVALVESAFGSDTTIMNAYPKGGIWQITPDIHQTVSNARKSIPDYLKVMEEILGSSVVDFDSDDYSVPLKSALAARIFLKLSSERNLPGPLDEQGQWWATNYNTRARRAEFISLVQSYKDATRCKVSKLDLWFLIDGSASIDRKHFTTCLEFVNKTAAAFPISADEVRTGLMVYSSSTNVISRFDQHLSNEEFSNVVLQTAYPHGGRTKTGAAISEVQKRGFSVNNGARHRTEGVPRILIVLTDGKSFDGIKGPSDNIKKYGVTVFGVGVGNRFDKAEVEEISSDPDSEHAYEFTKFEALANVLQERFPSQACTIPAVIPDDTSISVVVDAQSTFYSQISLPSSGSVELEYEMSFNNSIGIVYVSDSVANPSKALYDVSFDVNVGNTKKIIDSRNFVNSPWLINNRRKRATPELNSKPLYLAFVPQSDSPVHLKFKAKSSTARTTASPITPTSGAASGRRNLMLTSIVLLILPFACIYG